MGGAANRLSTGTGSSVLPPFLKLAALLITGGAVIAAHAAGDAAARLRQAVDAACGDPSISLAQMADGIPGSTGVSDSPLIARGAEIGWERELTLPDGAEISVERFAPGGRLRRLVAEYRAVDPDGGTRPRLAAIADASCTIHAGRRLLYEPDFPRPVAIEHLGGDLSAATGREPLNPPVPPGTDPGGVAVALVDAGVNYLLDGISRRLARDSSGEILGHDYWDLDGRPFDANPARSPFFPQRHGTKTAGLLLREAPGVRLVPYRYPRPDMGRMTDLIRAADDAGITIVNISMGSNDRADWDAFAAAAGKRPHMLFVLSAGNNGRDIDAQPVYPAALRLDNAITVTSSENDGEPAYGSNWGSRSVDLLVPAERLLVTGFDGNETTASGSSYAAVRVSALAARLLAEHPDWHAAELKDAIFSRVLPASIDEQGDVARGFMPRPDKAEHLPPMAGAGEPEETGRYAFDAGELYRDSAAAPRDGHIFKPTFAYLVDTAWTLDALRRHAREMAAILAQCGIYIPEIDLRVLDGPDVYRYFHDVIGTDFVRRLPLPTPTVYFVRDTLQVNAYDAEAIGKANSTTRPDLRYTVWFTEATRDPGIALAHELSHILMDSGRHVETPGNLMRSETSAANTELTATQCQVMVAAGTANGLLDPLSREQ